MFPEYVPRKLEKNIIFWQFKKNINLMKKSNDLNFLNDPRKGLNAAYMEIFIGIQE